MKYKIIIKGVYYQEVLCSTLEEAEICKAYFEVQPFAKEVLIEKLL